MPEEEGLIPEQDLVVVEERWAKPEKGRYGIVRAAEWCSPADPVTLWRGPEEPDERVERKLLREISCRTILVDGDGFYTCTPLEKFEPYPCPQITEDMEDEVEKVAEEFLNKMANERAAESKSYVDAERGEEEFEGEVFAIATFGDATAVNGELVFGKDIVRPPRGWVESDFGGRIPGGEEEEIEKAWLSEGVAVVLKDKIPAWLVERAIDARFSPGKEYIMWTSDSGDSEVWVSKRAMRAFEKKEEGRRTEKEKREREKQERERREAEERRKKEEAERREKIRKGGWPSPREWSPRGKLPGE